MSPRRNHPARRRRSVRRSRPVADPGEFDPQRLGLGAEAVQTWEHQQWRVRHIPGGGAVKTYRCPGCDHEIRPGTPHLVVLPVDDRTGEAERRHWHAGCWRARDRRHPAR